MTEFKRNTAAFLDELRHSGLPLVLTINGKAALVVQEAGAYQKLIEAVDQIEAIVGIKEGLASMDRGEGRPAMEHTEAQIRRRERGGARCELEEFTRIRFGIGQR